MTSSPEIVLNLQRQERLGLGEAAYCVGKTPEQFVAILGLVPRRGAACCSRDSMESAVPCSRELTSCRGRRKGLGKRKAHQYESFFAADEWIEH
jgi:hypothetical protein